MKQVDQVRCEAYKRQSQMNVKMCRIAAGLNFSHVKVGCDQEPVVNRSRRC